MMDNSFSQQVDESQSVLILLPNDPSFDQVAAGLSLYLSLREKKPVVISAATPMMVGVNRLVGVDKISQEIGNKNLSITFPNYDAANIEKVSYDIENGQFKLTVIPKSGFTAPQKEQIDMNYSGVSSDLIVLIGGVQESDFPTLKEKGLEEAKILNINSRVLSSDSGKAIMSFAKPASSLSELVASLIKETNFPIDADVATNLVMGIEEGSEHFEGEDVTPETFEMFAYLLKNGGQRLPKSKFGPQSFPPGSIPGEIFTQKPETKAAKSGTDSDEEGVDENAPDEWLQPKVYKGATNVSMSDSFSENKG